jgi:hypothetical protein
VERYLPPYLFQATGLPKESPLSITQLVVGGRVKNHGAKAGQLDFKVYPSLGGIHLLKPRPPALERQVEKLEVRNP